MHKSGKKRPNSRLSKLKLSTKKRKKLPSTAPSTGEANKENKNSSKRDSVVRHVVLQIQRRDAQSTLSDPSAKELFHVSKPLHLYEPYYLPTALNTLGPPNSPEIDLFGSARRKPDSRIVSHDRNDLLLPNATSVDAEHKQNDSGTRLQVKGSGNVRLDVDGPETSGQVLHFGVEEKVVREDDEGGRASPTFEFELEGVDDDQEEESGENEVAKPVENDAHLVSNKQPGSPEFVQDKINSSSFEFELEHVHNEDNESMRPEVAVQTRQSETHLASDTLSRPILAKSEAKPPEVTLRNSRRDSASFEFEIDDINDEEVDSRAVQVVESRISESNLPLNKSAASDRVPPHSPTPVEEKGRRDSSPFEFEIEDLPEEEDEEPHEAFETSHAGTDEPIQETFSPEEPSESSSRHEARERRRSNPTPVELDMDELTVEENKPPREAAPDEKENNPVQSAPTFASQVTGKGPFTCIYCYTENEDDVVCLLCGKPRPPLDRRWECASCTTDNLPADSRCSNCNMRRTANCKLSDMSFSQSSEIVYEKVLSDSYDSDNENASGTKWLQGKERRKDVMDKEGAPPKRKGSVDSFENEEFDLRMDADEADIEHMNDNVTLSQNREAASSIPPDVRDTGSCSSGNEEFDLSMDNGDEDAADMGVNGTIHQRENTTVEVGSDKSSVGSETFELSMDDHEQDYSFSQAHVMCNICHQVSQNGSVLLECSKCSLHVHAACYRVSPTELARSSTFTCKACKPRGAESQNHYITVCDDDVEEMDTQASHVASRANQLSASSAPELIDLVASPVINRAVPEDNFGAFRSTDRNDSTVSSREFEHFVPLSKLPRGINRNMFKTKFASVNFSRLDKRAEKLQDMEGKAPSKAKKGKRGGYRSKGKARYSRR